MNPTNLVRIWKDPDAEGRADHPAGEIDLAVGGFAQILATEYLSTLRVLQRFHPGHLRRLQRRGRDPVI